MWRKLFKRKSDEKSRKTKMTVSSEIVIKPGHLFPFIIIQTKMEDFGISVEQLNSAARECEKRLTIKRRSKLIKTESNMA